MIHHLCVSVRGVLKDNNRTLVRQWKGAITNNQGVVCRTADQIRSAFLDELALGHEYVPFGKCDNFDWKSGCKGHDSESDVVSI